MFCICSLICNLSPSFDFFFQSHLTDALRDCKMAAIAPAKDRRNTARGAIDYIQSLVQREQKALYGEQEVRRSCANTDVELGMH